MIYRELINEMLRNDYAISTPCGDAGLAGSDVVKELCRVYLAMQDGPLKALYDAAEKGFHTSQSCGPDGKYIYVSQFKTLQDLQDYHKAWVAAMVSVRDTFGGEQ